MSLNTTPAAERTHIGIFGKRNAGKSSLINALTGQELAIVSDISGTTTDPVYKAMELLPLGPVVLIDTPGIDDEGELGELRVKKSYQVLNKTDLAILVCSAEEGIAGEDIRLLERIQSKKIPWILVMNKTDLIKKEDQKLPIEILKKFEKEESDVSALWVSAEKGEQIYELKEQIAGKAQKGKKEKPLVSDLLSTGDCVVLVIPIDKAAPKGRLILPQQQTIRDALEAGASVMVTRDHELQKTLEALKEPPKMVITDSQVFGKVAKLTPKKVLLTSFSILFARYKGELRTQVNGAKKLDSIQDGDRILVCEGCTHHRQCDDIGTVKLPAWIRNYTKKEPVFEFTSGGAFPENLKAYQLIIHCGGCMLNEREIKYRIACAKDADIPIANYGVAIAYMNGILKRSVEIFPDIYQMFV